MKQKLLLFLNILLGNALLAFAICAFVVPNGFMLGGSNGIALFIQDFWPKIPLSDRALWNVWYRARKISPR